MSHSCRSRRIVTSETRVEPAAAIYRFCAQSMRYPEDSWFSGKYLERLSGLLESLGGHDERAALLAACPTEGACLEQLQIEYTRLFINGIPHTPAPPYGSVYLNRSLRGHYSDELTAFYRSLGYSFLAAGDLPDHIVYQLELLSHLAEDCNRAGEEEFLRRFFLPWFGAFAERVERHASLPFYRIIVTIIDFFTKEEEEHGVQCNEA